MSAIDEFGGVAVSSAWQNVWPSSRGTLEVSVDAIARLGPSGRRDVRRASDGASVTITRYRYFPFCMRTIVWIDRTSRSGFVPHRSRAVRSSLVRHHWHVDVESKSWLSLVSDLRAAWRSYIDTGELPST